MAITALACFRLSGRGCAEGGQGLQEPSRSWKIHLSREGLIEAADTRGGTGVFFTKLVQYHLDLADSIPHKENSSLGAA